MKVVGLLLWRDETGQELLVGSGWDETVTIRLRPTSPGKYLRVGDTVTVRGRIAFLDEGEPEREVPEVDRAYLIRAAPVKKP